MKPVEAMTDQELNEWVMIHIMGIDPSKYCDGSFERLGVDYESIGVDDNQCLKCGMVYGGNFLKHHPMPYNYCQDLNATHLMEEKLLNTHRITGYLHQLALTVGYVIGDFFGTFPVCDMVHASARQRCEAAYLSVGDLSFE